MNEKQIKRATHVGVVVNYTNTVFDTQIVHLKRQLHPRPHTFVFAKPDFESRRPASESLAYIYKEGNRWEIPNSHSYFSVIDGEMMVKSHDAFYPIYLDLESIKEL